MKLDKVQSFLQAMDYDFQNPEKFKKGEHDFFVTISREAGAGGHSVAEALTGEMKNLGKDPIFKNWQVVDHELCQMVIEKLGCKFSPEQMISIEYRPQIEDMMHELILGSDSQDVIVKKVFETIRVLAVVGKVIIIGRAGVCVTQGLKSGIHVRLVAPLSFRIERVRARFNLTEKEAKTFISEQDKSREKLVQTFFNRNIGDPLLYDMVFNTERLSEKEIAHSILNLMLQRKAVSV